MLRLIFAMSVLLAVAGGLVAGSATEQVVALVLLGAVAFHRAVLVRAHQQRRVGLDAPTALGPRLIEQLHR